MATWMVCRDFKEREGSEWKVIRNKLGEKTHVRAERNSFHTSQERKIATVLNLLSRNKKAQQNSIYSVTVQKGTKRKITLNEYSA